MEELVTLKDSNGKCTKCGSEVLDYKSLMATDDGITYPYICTECGHEGDEYYTLNYIGSK